MLMRHLEVLRPFGVALEIEPAETGKGFAPRTAGPAYDAARAALATAWGAETVSIATGGSIPLVSALSEAVPAAEMLLIGATDGFANIHAPNERVLVDEFEKAVVAEAEFFREYAARRGRRERARGTGGRRRRRGARLPRADPRRDRAGRATRCRTRRSCSSRSAAS